MKKVRYFMLCTIILSTNISASIIQKTNTSNSYETTADLKDIESDFDDLFQDDDVTESQDTSNKQFSVTQIKDAMKLFYSLPIDIKMELAKLATGKLLDHIIACKLIYGGTSITLFATYVALMKTFGLST